MIIEKYCSRMRRYLVKFEHYETCIAGKDVNEARTEEQWIDRFLDYMSKHELRKEGEGQ